MKTFTQKLLTALLIASASLTVACQKKNDDVASVPPLGYGACAGGCPVGGVVIANVTASHPAGLTFPGLQIFGNGGGNVGMGYSSQVAFGGQLHVQNGNGIPAGGLCWLMPGIYTVNTVQGGMMNWPVFSGVTLQAVGPVTVEFTLQAGHVDGPGSIEADMVVQRVNGQSCSDWSGLNYFLIN